MTRASTFPAAFLAAACLAGCASAPISFYTLVPATTAEALPAQDPAFQIEVQTVDVPAQVDVPQMVVRESSGAVTPVATRRWIAPLSSEIRGALVAALTRRLGVPEVSGVAAEGSLPLYRIRLSVRRFDSTLGDAARIEAVWTIAAARDAKRSVTCESRVSVPVAPGYSELAEGHQRVIAQIADGIAQTLPGLNSGRASCADAAR